MQLIGVPCRQNNWKRRVQLFVPFGRARPEKFSFSVRTYPSLGGSTTSANLWYAFLVSCSVASGKPVEEGAASWERDGVDIDRYTFSGSDAEACNVFADA
jgi:hypothetical protein